MNIGFKKLFHKCYKRLRKNEQLRVDERIKLFVENPHHPLLDNHPLSGDRSGEYAIHIGGDLSAIYIFRYDGAGMQYVYFTELGTHHELYGK